MIADMWFTVLRWTLLAAAVGLVVGTPVVYMNHRIDQAHQLGMDEGKAACQADQARLAQEQVDETLARIALESIAAQKADEAARKLKKEANDTKAKLDDALKAPNSVDCSIPERATDILRNATRGAFDTTEEGDALSVTPHPRVRVRT